MKEDPDVPIVPLTGNTQRRIPNVVKDPVQTVTPIAETLGFESPKTSRSITTILEDCHRNLNLIEAHIHHLMSEVARIERIERIQSERSESQSGEVPSASMNSATGAEGSRHE